MVETLTLETTDAESWAPQHWSRAEWFYMWTRGLDPWRIAVLCRVPHRKVYDHIRTRIMHKPELFGQRLMLHDRPAVPPGGLRKSKPTWEERCAELIEFRQAHGRFPRGYVQGESSLYSFLQSQRERYRAGMLAEGRKSYLDERVRGWLTPPKAERERALWDQRLGEMEKFLQDSGRYPRYKTAKDSSEKVLAVWVARQRDCQRRGVLDRRRQQRLDDRLPGWTAERLT